MILKNILILGSSYATRLNKDRATIRDQQLKMSLMGKKTHSRDLIKWKRWIDCKANDNDMGEWLSLWIIRGES